MYFGKRYYSPYLLRWMTVDPLEVHKSGEADANLYAYVSGAALKNVDPLGLRGGPAIANRLAANNPARVWEDTKTLAATLRLPTSVLHNVESQRVKQSDTVEAGWSHSQGLLYSNSALRDLAAYSAGRRPAPPAWVSDHSKHHRGVVAGLMNTAYHEAAHKASYEIGLQHMGVRLHREQNAWLVYEPGQAPRTDEEQRRAVSEAISGYVGSKVERFVNAVMQVQEGITPLDKIAAEYNAGVRSEKKFGYYQNSQGGFVYATDDRLPEELKVMVDERILNGQVPDRFEDSQVFKTARANEKSDGK